MYRVVKYRYRLYQIILYFLIYSFIGWSLETLYVSANSGRLINRGFLNGPFCPIYGFGALLIIHILKPFKKNYFALFISSVLITSVLEYVTAVLLKVLFNKTLWNYSHEPFNIAGRICLKNSLIWGVSSFLLLYVIHPYICNYLSRIPEHYAGILSFMIIVYLAIDLILSVTFITGSNGSVHDKVAGNHDISGPDYRYEQSYQIKTSGLLYRFKMLKEKALGTFNRKPEPFSPTSIKYNLKNTDIICCLHKQSKPDPKNPAFLF